MQNPKHGYQITGQCKGYFENTSKDGRYTNRFLAIVISSYHDKYGEQQEFIEDIEVSPKIAGEVGQSIRDLAGKTVTLNVGIQHKQGEKNGKAWSFVKKYLRDADIVEHSNPKIKAA